ncbi:MAG: hypothetical protein J7J28_05260 [Thaumarchaeota archaeon]|nr:hypothetical protein [Nitrososphaerota archaeon]
MKELRRALDEQKKALWELHQLLLGVGYALTVLQELARSLSELNRTLEEVTQGEAEGNKSG